MRISLVAVFLMSATLAHAQDQSLPALPIIDMHVHADDDLDNLRLLERHRVVLAILIGNSETEFRRWGDSTSIMFVSSLLFPCRVQQDNRYGVDCYADDGAYYPDPTWRTKPFVLPDPGWVRQQLQREALKSLGEVTSQYWGMEPSDPALEPYFALAEQFDVPVGIHLALAPPGEPYRRPSFRARLGNPLLLEDVLARHPKLRLWVMHAGHPYQEEMIALLSIYPKVHVDISAINVSQILPRQAFHDYLEGLVKAGFGKRILFGSDFTSVLEETIGAITSARFLSEEQKRDILYNNAARFLRLSSAEIAQHHRLPARPRR
jgi:hypothetical protein